MLMRVYGALRKWRARCLRYTSMSVRRAAKIGARVIRKEFASAQALCYMLSVRRYARVTLRVAAATRAVDDDCCAFVATRLRYARDIMRRLLMQSARARRMLLYARSHADACYARRAAVDMLMPRLLPRYRADTLRRALFDIATAYFDCHYADAAIRAYAAAMLARLPLFSPRALCHMPPLQMPLCCRVYAAPLIC